ncbi:MAG TPA: hypothetical protein VGI10_10355 [Polyangiaceae bacterium]
MKFGALPVAVLLAASCGGRVLVESSGGALVAGGAGGAGGAAGNAGTAGVAGKNGIVACPDNDAGVDTVADINAKPCSPAGQDCFGAGACPIRCSCGGEDLRPMWSCVVQICP